MSYRFRVDEGKLVLQVYVPPTTSRYSYDSTGTWRDATVEDIPVADPFKTFMPQPEKCYAGASLPEMFP